MATNIGRITFSVDADTRGLQKANAQLKQFEQANNRLARSTAKTAKAEVTARARQEQAIRKALQQTVQLRREQQKAKATPELLAKTTAAYKRLVNALSQGKVNTLQFNRAVDRFNASINRTRRETDNFRISMQKTNGAGAKFITIMRDLESSSVLALGPLSGLGARIRSLSAIFSRSGLVLGGIVTVVAGVVIALGKIAGASVRAGEAMKGLQLRFEAATGSASSGRAALEGTINTAKSLGLEVQVLAKGYARFKAASAGTTLEGEKSEKIFQAMARASAALKLDATELEGVFRAIEQIMSKGTVQAEELRGQLGDRLPGAFRIASEAMGVSTQELNKMLKNGEVLADEFLPKFAEGVEKAYGKNAQKNLTTVSGQWNNLKTNMLQFFAAADETLKTSEAVNFFLRSINFTLNEIVDDTPEAVGSLHGLTSGFQGLYEATEQLSASSGFNLTNVFNEIQALMTEAGTETAAMAEALRVMGSAGAEAFRDMDPEDNLEMFQLLVKANGEELQKLALILDNKLGNALLTTKPTIEGVAAAMAQWQQQIQRTRDAYDGFFKIDEVLEDIAAATEKVNARNEVLSAGDQGLVKKFDLIAQGVRQYDEALKELNVDEARRLQILAPLIAALERQAELEGRLAEQKKASDESDRKAERAAKALAAAQAKVALAQQQLAAMRMGPDAAEEFQKVTRPLEQMAKALKDAGVEGAAAKQVLAEYEEQLRGMFSLTNRIARAHQQMADAITRSLEDLIVEGGSVKDMLHELAKELLRVAIRALFLDKLRFSLFSIFSGGGFPGIATAGAGVGGGGGPVTPAGGGLYATGGSFKLTGSGGSDKIPFFGVGRAGETVSITRPSQGAGVGGGINIVQNNNFEGVQGAQELIPILEANNRRLKADILANMDRRTL